jgi:hypothetical protein
MRRSELYLALLGTLVATTATQAGDCDGHVSAPCPSSHCATCEGGLLDVISDAASRVHSDVRQLSRSMRASRNSKYCDHGCDAGSSMTVEQAYQPDCPHCHSGSSDHAVHGQLQPTAPRVLPHSTVPNMPQPENLRSIPAPVADPDAHQDPFVDEPRTGSRSIPGRTIQYQRKSLQRPSYGLRYHKQAHTTTTADYWAGSEPKSESDAWLVQTASNNPASMEAEFQFAHRRRVVDGQANALPTDGGPGTSVKNSAKKIIEGQVGGNTQTPKLAAPLPSQPFANPLRP